MGSSKNEVPLLVGGISMMFALSGFVSSRQQATQGTGIPPGEKEPQTGPVDRSDLMTVSHCTRGSIIMCCALKDNMQILGPEICNR